MRTNPLKLVVARACTDATYRARLLAEPHAALAEDGVEVPPGVEVRVHESTDDKILIVLPTSHGTEFEESVSLPPPGPVADVPPGLTLEWQATMLIARGKVDASNAKALRRELERAFVDIGLDCAGVTSMSSAGVGALVAGQRRLSERECSLCLYDVAKPIRNVFELAGLLEMFEMRETVGAKRHAGHDAAADRYTYRPI
ncbi:MAG: STAS domain-containing protein [Planctomycetota bacterium]